MAFREVCRLYCRAKLFAVKDFFWALRFHFFKYLLFLPADFFLFAFSFFINPYRHSRKYFLKQGRKTHPYGETSLKTALEIVRQAGLGPQDMLVELGSGRGRAAWWLFSVLKCRYVGIEQIGLFVWFNRLLRCFFCLFFIPASKLKKIRFYFTSVFSRKYWEHENRNVCNISFFKADYTNFLAAKKIFSSASAIYLYGSNLENAFLLKLLKQLKSTCSPKTKFITVSYSFGDLDRDFYTAKSWPADFAWGKTRIYLSFLKPSGT